MSEAEDREEILALIHANRIGFWTKDFDMWSACFVQADYTTRWSYTVQGGTAVRRGWDDILRRAMPVFETDEIPANHDFAYKTTVENLTLVISGDMGWAVYDQHHPRVGFDGFRGSGVTHDFRVFERHDGRWRISMLGHMGNNGLHDGAAMFELTGDGSVVWASDEALTRLPDDDALVIRNGKLRIRDTACQRRLETALTWAAQVDSGYNPSRGSVPIVLGAGEGIPTRIWWVQVDAGSIYFLMDQQTMSDQRLDIAAAIFGLSPAQRRLAGHIADGRSLPDAAREMTISASTAKTHLQRIYEKTGVHTQPALIRVLLSVGLPV
jgi:DNA-binding CsgD family transcriptional regulator